jgi:4-hydroxy-3-methylbut-2-enyl diphosphate reductase IspH
MYSWLSVLYDLVQYSEKHDAQYTDICITVIKAILHNRCSICTKYNMYTYMFICRWDDTANISGSSVHYYIVRHFPSDSTTEVRELVDPKGGHYFDSTCPIMLKRQVYAQSI